MRPWLPPQQAWKPDDESAGCDACHEPFTVLNRRHHCRCCGNIFCGGCSDNFVPLPALGFVFVQRVCAACEAAVRAQALGAGPAPASLDAAGDAGPGGAEL